MVVAYPSKGSIGPINMTHRAEHVCFSIFPTNIISFPLGTSKIICNSTNFIMVFLVYDNCIEKDALLVE